MAHRYAPQEVEDALLAPHTFGDAHRTLSATESAIAGGLAGGSAATADRAPRITISRTPSYAIARTLV